jgi:hypothetical protein
VAPLAVIGDRDVLADGGLGLCTGGKGAVVDELIFEAPQKALHRRVVKQFPGACQGSEPELQQSALASAMTSMKLSVGSRQPHALPQSYTG